MQRDLVVKKDIYQLYQLAFTGSFFVVVLGISACQYFQSWNFWELESQVLRCRLGIFFWATLFGESRLAIATSSSLMACSSLMVSGPTGTWFTILVTTPYSIVEPWLVSGKACALIKVGTPQIPSSTARNLRLSRASAVSTFSIFFCSGGAFQLGQKYKTQLRISWFYTFHRLPPSH